MCCTLKQAKHIFSSDDQVEIKTELSKLIQSRLQVNMLIFGDHYIKKTELKSWTLLEWYKDNSLSLSLSLSLGLTLLLRATKTRGERDESLNLLEWAGTYICVWGGEGE